MMQHVRLMMFSLNMVDCSMSFLSLSTCWTGRKDQFEPFLLFEVYCGTPPSCLKVMGWWGGGVGWGGGPWDFSVSPRPLGFGFLGLGLRGLGPGLDNIIRLIFHPFHSRWRVIEARWRMFHHSGVTPCPPGLGSSLSALISLSIETLETHFTLYSKEDIQYSYTGSVILPVAKSFWWILRDLMFLF